MKDAPLKLINFFSGGGGGSAPKAPTLQQVDTSLTGPLYTQSSTIGDQWAAMMRRDYGFAPGGPAWRAPLGKGALAMQAQAAAQEAGTPDKQVTGTLKTAGFGGGPLTMNLSPYQMSQELGQQFRAPYQQLQRNQQFTSTLAQEWPPPQLRLTGQDLMSVALQQQAQNAQAQQQAFEAQLMGSSASAAAQAASQGALYGALGKVAGSGINAFFSPSPSLSSSGYYQPSPFSMIFGGGGSTPATDMAAGGEGQGYSNFSSPG